MKALPRIRPPSLDLLFGRALLLVAWVARSWLVLLALLVASLLPLSLRLLHMAESGYGLRLYDWSGIVGDLLVGAAAALLLAMAFNAGWLVFAAAVAVWLGVNTGYYEFLREYGSSYFAVHAGQLLHWSFFRGSATSLSHPWLIAVGGGVVAASAAYVGASARQIARTWLAGAAAVLLCAGMLLPGTSWAPVWRQTNFVAANLADLYARALPRYIGTAQAVDTAQLSAFLTPDLSGRPILQAAGKRNVVMIFVEGLSGGFLPSLADAHGATSTVTLPGLDATARRALSYSTFVTHQKQSNRGMFAALCGVYPHLAAAVAEMTEIANAPGRDCLPAVLRAHGYATLFMKSADSSYMDMKNFALKVGFDRAFGEEGFPASYPRGSWGLDDWSLYEGSLAEIEALDKADSPFFATLFTSGTHHPYNVPESFSGLPGAPARDRAWAFADEALGRFLAALETRGLMDDTLVLVTSDEASVVREAPPGRKDETLVGLTENWGLMLAMAPEGVTGRVDDLFQQADIPLSVLDYLGFGRDGGPFIGRSLFRTYTEPRRVYFANIYKGLVYEYVDEAQLSICSEALEGCRGYDVSHGRLFGHELAATGGVAASAMLRAVMAHSMLSPLPAPAH